MKKFLMGSLVMTSLLVACQVLAELVVYQGTDKVNYLGSDRNVALTWNIFLVIAHDTGNVGGVSYLNYQSTKHYSTSTVTYLQFVQASGANGTTYTVLSHPLDPCETDQGFTSEGLMV